MSDKAVKVVVSIPNEGHPPCEAYVNRLENFFYMGTLQERGMQEKRNPRFEFQIVTLGRIFTPLAREEAADVALSIDADYLFMIDDDMTCPNQLFERLYAHQVDIVAPLAFTRNFPHHAVIYQVEDGWDPVSQSAYFVNHKVDKYPENTLVECDAVGFGAVLIHTRVLKAMPKPRFMCSSGTGEDIVFCHKARKLGFRVFMDTATKLGHLSHPIEVTEEYVKRVRKEMNYMPPNGLSSKAKPTEMKPNEALLILGD